ncbi:TetR family transcriptional regulator [Brevibacterium sanguinis]|uniref:TetR family transcriptional regulator n=3 Tax=Brevibacteriaceae TaxID=85019 RepID=A0A366IMQ2_9MICO|nr:TetR family transcriptional regulator [Brevibacterium sanguinis]RBP72336.1 TetR family transcriptional regulator [Brevibacterium celere]
MTSMTLVADASARRRPGRPRDEDLDERIIAATLRRVDAGEAVTVSRIVADSGVSRSAVYRRWPSLTALIAAALDSGRVVPTVVGSRTDLKESILDAILGPVESQRPYEERFRQRIRLVMSDRGLQKEYWSAHVAKRRVPIEEAIREGIERGDLRADLDVAACFDAIAGAIYYQYVVRGESLSEQSTRDRVRAAIEIIWRGMLSQGMNGSAAEHEHG